MASFDDLPSLQLDEAALSDLDLFLAGACWPQPRFIFAPPMQLRGGEPVLLRDANNVRLAVFAPQSEAPGGIAGDLTVIEPPRHTAFLSYRHAAEPFRAELGAGAVAVALAGFPTAELEAALRAAAPAPVLIVVIEPGPVDAFARVRAAELLAASLPKARVVVLPWVHGEADRRLERVLRNYGATRIVPAMGANYRPDIAAIVADAVRPPARQGFCVWFTGLPSSGKSTIADHLALRLRERGRRLTMLDGDVVRTHLSKGLGFSREDRDVNIRRIGWVAAEVVKHGGVAVVAAVSPFAASRDDARRFVGPNFVLIHVATPAGVCEQRDVKGFYQQARAGKITGFTGVDDPYEIPENAELTLPTSNRTADENSAVVLEFLATRGWIG